MDKLNFLVVEDHPFQRTMLQQLLRGLGVGAVHAAANGVEATRILREPNTSVDIVITDLMMPELDGIELLPLLRQSRPAAALVLTCVDPAVLRAAEVIAKAQGIAVLGTIQKPVTADKLWPLLGLYVAQQETAKSRPD